MSDVKLTSPVEERTVDVELDDKCFFGAVIMLLFRFHNRIQLVDFINYSDAVAAIGEFSGFDDPYISEWSFDLFSIFHFFFLLLDMHLSFLVVSQKAFILWIFCSLFDMES